MAALFAVFQLRSKESPGAWNAAVFSLRAPGSCVPLSLLYRNGRHIRVGPSHTVRGGELRYIVK